MNEKDMITVPYDDFVCGIQALQTLIAIRKILNEGEGFASGDIKSILGLDKEVNEDAGKN